jgi:hypothetical protein
VATFARKLSAALLLAGGVTVAAAPLTFANHGHARTIIDADVLVAVTPPYTGATNAIRGVAGGGAPWVIDEGELRLRSDGSVKAEVEGLVIDPAFPNPAIAGTNPVPLWKITVSCLTTDHGIAATANVSSAPFPADTAGNAKVETSVLLPHPCIAPIVFVAAAGGAWFAATGA